MLRTGWQELTDEAHGMPFLVLGRDGQPMSDPETGLICQFDTHDDAEAYRKANKGARVMKVPALS